MAKVFLVKTIAHVTAEGLDVAVAEVTGALKGVNADIVEVYGAPSMEIPAQQAEAQAPVVDLRKKKPAAKKKPAVTAPVEEELTELPAGEESMDGPALMAYCNEKLGALDKAARTAKIKEVVAMFKEDFGVEAVREIATAKVAEAKDKFDTIMAV